MPRMVMPRFHLNLRGILAVLPAVALAAAVLGFATVPAARAADPDLRGQWHLDVGATGFGNDSVSATPDSSGNGLTAIVRFTEEVPGRFATAFRYRASSLTETDSALLRPEHLTAIAWVRADTSPGNLRYVLAQGGSDGCIPAAYGLYTAPAGTPNAGGLAFYVNHAGIPYQAANVPAASIWNGSWHMVAGTFDGAKARFYVDGVEIGDGMHDGTDVPGPIDYSQPQSAFRIGRYGRFAVEPCAGAITAFSGDIDEVRVYSRALSASEISMLAANTWASPPDVGQFPPPPPQPPPPPPPDTTPPITTIALGPPDPTAGGYYPDQAGVLVSATDAPGMFETRCVLDPLFPPAEFEDMAPGCSFSSRAFVISEGIHTMYAASRDAAGNVERPLVTRTFRLLPTPRTTILDGPTGDTWVRDPVFGFASTISGSTLECRVDAENWGPCSSPYPLAPLSSGPHRFAVRATSPAGATELVPPQRAFTVAPTVRDRADCTIAPVVHWAMSWPSPLLDPMGNLLQGTYSCLVGLSPAMACPRGAVCTPKELTCPRGARCTLTTRGVWHDGDAGARQGVSVLASAGPITVRDFFGDFPTNQRVPYTRNWCFTTVDADRCSAETRLVVLGEDRPLYASCSWTPDWPGALVAAGLGDPEARRITCRVTMTIEPPKPLFTLPIGMGIVTSAPAAGMIVATWNPANPGMARSSAAARPRITTTRVAVKRSGAVRIVPHLNAATARQLRRTKRLAVSVRLTFIPKTGKRIVKEQRVTLTAPARPHRLCLPARPTEPTKRKLVIRRC